MCDANRLAVRSIAAAVVAIFEALVPALRLELVCDTESFTLGRLLADALKKKLGQRAGEGMDSNNVILQMPDVADVATVGVPDPVYGEQVIVYIQPKVEQWLTVEAVLEHCGRHLADFKMPHEVIFRDELPKTQRGKMDRNALTAEWKAENAVA